VREPNVLLGSKLETRGLEERLGLGRAFLSS
jgi:hypothetical protein